MAKLGLLFIATFCIVQLAWAARLPRETPAVDATTQNAIIGRFEEGWTRLQEDFQKAFTKENFDKFSETVSKKASEINSQLKELGTDVQTKFKEFTKDTEEKNA